MNLEKIGKFIAQQRKNANLTQIQLAEKLCVTDRAVSKWENGKSMPDSSIMVNLCNILKITVNDLLCGEIVSTKDYNKQLENNLLVVTKEKEQAHKTLLSLEVFISITVSVLLICCILAASFISMPVWLRIAFIALGVVPFAIGICLAVKIEQVAGYYQCPECGCKYVPEYKSVLFSMHVNRTRFMRCPNCKKKAWHKKVLDNCKEDKS